ncbi:MAG: hypothetical protein LBU34_07785 [Planctomycetaceae bacterium]|jgi:hypothetical protein|nr:hypothetical protein [Planctomycetaceae bacterium]
MNVTIKTISKFSLFDAYDVIVTWMIGLTFLLAGMVHWENPYFFLGSVYAYKLVDPGFGQMIAISLPLIQLVLAIFLLSRVFIDVAHLGSLFLLICFATIQTLAYLQGLDISCGCFGPEHEMIIGFRTLFFVYSLLFFSLIRNIVCLFYVGNKTY